MPSNSTSYLGLFLREMQTLVLIYVSNAGDEFQKWCDSIVSQSNLAPEFEKPLLGKIFLGAQNYLAPGKVWSFQPW